MLNEAGEDAFRVGFCVSGGGKLARAAIAFADQLGIVPALMVCERKADPELEPLCRARGVPFRRLPPGKPREVFDAELTNSCIAADLDLLCLTFEKLVPPALVSRYRGRVLNVHPALLPAFKGLDGLGDALRAGARFVGATIHEVDEGMDTGPTLIQGVISVRATDTKASVGARLFNVMQPMYLQSIAWYAQGRVERQPNGTLTVRDAVYGELPISPAIELVNTL